MCDYFAGAWSRAQRSAAPRAFSVFEKQQVEFPKFEFFIRREPPRSTHLPCKCGAPDRWRCWIRTKQDLLLGEDRRR
jgi:hypothetical protein